MYLMIGLACAAEIDAFPDRYLYIEVESVFGVLNAPRHGLSRQPSQAPSLVFTVDDRVLFLGRLKGLCCWGRPCNLSQWRILRALDV